MRDKRVESFFWSAGLVVTGIILILFNFGLLDRFEPVAQIILAAGLGVIGIGFFGSYFRTRTMWWRLIPGWTLLAVAAMVLATTIPDINTMAIPAVLFLGLALAFGNIYLINRSDNWWAIIPGGFMLALGLVIWLNTYVSSLEALFAILLIGMGLVFLLISLLGPSHVRWWPLLPGMVLGLFGLYLLTGGDSNDSALLKLWPIALVALGLFMGWRGALRTPPKERMSVNVAPGLSTAGSISSTKDEPFTARDRRQQTGVLGEYSEPAPGASVEVFSDADSDRNDNK